MADLTEALVERLREASAAGTPLRIVGGDSKRCYGREVGGTALEVAGHCGIVSHDPAELVLTARAGTSLAEIEDALANHGQRLPFDPPRFGAATTLGGAIAAGLAGPSRAWSGPVRDYVLGVRLLTGDGRALRFGGEVMKNVAGYDVARLMAGSLGILGVLTEVSVKVLPRSPSERTRVLEVDQAGALRRAPDFARSGLPLTASCWHAGRLYLRFEGSEATLAQIARSVGGEELGEADAFWRALRDHRARFFTASDGPGASLWRLTVPSTCPPLPTDAEPLLEWNGMQRWYTGLEAEEAWALAAAARGFATWFRGAPVEAEVFAPLAAPQLELHRALKRIFDPAGILNRGRMYGSL